ncbi:MAG: hypothetical protein EXS03_04730 [Phycisphaerales bacterium]|nr:hypothetical protein [Phycisphaerales bacterium]
MKPAVARAIPVGFALLIAVALLVAAWKFDETIPKTDRNRRVPIEELVAPEPLTQAERDALIARAGTGNTIQLDQGAWVQVAGKDGKVAQQYVAQRIDPQPGAYMRMDAPRAVFYLDDGRVATLRSSQARVHVPNRALESGEFTGEVVVRMYRPKADGRVDLVKDSPALILEAEQMDFDQVIGSLACPGYFRLTTDMLTFDGEGLELLLAPDGRTIQRLSVEHPLGPIVIDRAKNQLTAASSNGNRAVANYEADTIAWRPWESSPKLDPQGEAAQFYRLELHDDVEVLRYSSRDRAWSTGDLLTAIFTLNSDLISKEISSAAPARSLPTPKLTRAFAGGLLARIAAAALSSTPAPAIAVSAPPLEGDLLVVRFTGRLLLEPVGARDAVPTSATDMKVALDGKEVELATDAGLAMRAQEIDIDLSKGANQATTPTLLLARGAVEATDSLQTLWCDSLTAHFEPAAAPSQSSEGTLGDPALGPAEVTRMEAKDGVQIQLKDGARVFAQSMTAFPQQHRAELVGPGISLVRSGVLIEGLPELRVDEATRSAISQGGGRARSWTTPILASDTEGASRRVAIPSPPTTVPQLDANWSETMTYADHADEGATLDLKGKVKVRAQPGADEFDALDAASVHLEFVRAGSAAPLGSAPTSVGPSGAEVTPRRLLAKGDARIENQKWPTAARQGEPRLFSVKAETIDYDAVAGEADIPCAGSALIYVPAGSSQDARVASGRPRDQLVPGGGVEGVSRFRWGGSMTLKRVVDDRYLMTMDSSVELVRAGSRKDDTLTVTCDRLEASLAQGTGAAADSGPGAFDLGGSAELKRVRGLGRCFIRTPQYDIECEEFDYDTVTQIAQLKARAGRLVNVLPKGQGSPIRAASMIWDLSTGRIQIRSGSGSLSG